MLNHPPCARESSEGRTSQISHDYTDQHLWTLNRSPQPWNRKKEQFSTIEQPFHLLLFLPKFQHCTCLLKSESPELLVLHPRSWTRFSLSWWFSAVTAFILLWPFPLFHHPATHSSTFQADAPGTSPPPPTRNNWVAGWTEAPVMLGLGFLLCVGKAAGAPVPSGDPGAGLVGILSHIFPFFVSMQKSYAFTPFAFCT